MEKRFEYDVFLSFSSADKNYVHAIWQALISSGLRVFWSDESLKEKVGKEDWIDVIQKSLVSSQHFLLLSSNKAVDSYWVQQEYSSFINLCHSKDVQNRLFAILPIPGFVISELPAFLQNKQIAQTISDVIPLLGGVDFQKEFAEKQALKDKLILERENIAKEKRQHAQEFVAWAGEKQTLSLRIEALVSELAKKDSKLKEKEILSMQIETLTQKLGSQDAEFIALNEERENLLLNTFNLKSDLKEKTRDIKSLRTLMEEPTLKLDKQSNHNDINYRHLEREVTTLKSNLADYKTQLEDAREQHQEDAEELNSNKQKNNNHQSKIAQLESNILHIKMRSGLKNTNNKQVLYEPEPKEPKEPAIEPTAEDTNPHPSIIILLTIILTLDWKIISTINVD